MDKHQKAVSAISSDIASFHQRQVPFRLYHGATNSTQARQVDPNRMIDTSGLNHVLKVDTASKTCLVEPNVPMDQLVDATLPHSLLAPVVTEFPGITVGGAFAGMAGESSGFKYGFFESIVNWIEIVLPNGEVVTTSRHERSDLFYGAAGSLGTLGVTTLLELQLIDSKPYVELTYHPTTDISHAVRTMALVGKTESIDYVDGILFAADRGVVIAGRLTDEVSPETRIQHFSKARDPLFYIHADRLTRRISKPVKEITSIRDYLFRYDRGAFWTAKYAFKYFSTPFNRVTRWAANHFLHTRVMYHALHESGHASRYILQDLLLPEHTVASFIDHVAADLNFWPLWLCPFTVDGPLPLRPRLPPAPPGEEVGRAQRTLINVGVWGPGPTQPERFLAVNRRLERVVRELGGVKWLYAQGYYTADEFWAIYDREWYDELRAKYHAAYLPSVFEKVRFKPVRDDGDGDGGHRSLTRSLKDVAWRIWPVSGAYGVLKTLCGKDYLLVKR